MVMRSASSPFGAMVAFAVWDAACASVWTTAFSPEVQAFSEATPASAT